MAAGPPCTTFQNSVTAVISTSGGVASVSPDRACLAPGGTIKWTAEDGETWSTDFDDDLHSPFSPGRRHHSGAVRKSSGDKVRACSTGDSNFDASAGGCVFKYNAAHVKGGKKSTVDPDVIVKPRS